MSLILLIMLYVRYQLTGGGVCVSQSQSVLDSGGVEISRVSQADTLRLSQSVTRHVRTDLIIRSAHSQHVCLTVNNWNNIYIKSVVGWRQYNDCYFLNTQCLEWVVILQRGKEVGREVWQGLQRDESL